MEYYRKKPVIIEGTLNPRQCVTHHACDCRLARIAELEAEALRQGELAEEWAGKCRAMEVRAEKAEARTGPFMEVVRAAVALRENMTATEHRYALERFNAAVDALKSHPELMKEITQL